MANDDLIKFSAGTMDKPVQVFTSAFSPRLAFDWETWNISQGINHGVGPREGFALLPGQASNEVLAAAEMPNFRQSEGIPARGYRNRTKILAIFPITIGGPLANAALPSTHAIGYRQTYYGAIVVDSANKICVHVLSDNDPPAQQLPKLSGGLPDSSVTTEAGVAVSLLDDLVHVSPTGNKNSNFSKMLAFDSSLWFCSYDVFNVGGAEIDMQWYAGKALLPGDATHAPSLNLWRDNTLKDIFLTTLLSGMGPPSYYNYGDFKGSTRTIQVYGLTNQGGQNSEYKVTFAPTTSIFKPGIIYDATTRMLDLSATVASNTLAGVPANTKFALVYDPQSKTKSGYKAVAIAAKNPYLVILQDWSRNSDGSMPQYVDLTQDPAKPLNNTSDYFENTAFRTSCFAHWSDFVDGTTMIPAFAGGPQLLPPGSGILRKNTVYEFTFSIYNKRLNFETNVGQQVKIQTGSDDFVGLRLFASSAATKATLFENQMQGAGQFMPYPSADSYNFSGTYVSPANDMNYIEYRFYVRQLGTFEWLPAARIDAAELWFYPHNNFVACGNTPSPGSTGGQPGAFNDYSSLPIDQYNCVVQYKNRAFWFSENQMIFSLRDNLIAYPGRNSISAAGGNYRGGIVHNYPGQAEQNSRLIVFTNKGTYVGRFTGNSQQTFVPVSIDGSLDPAGPLNIDGSDFVLDPWTSVTSFSHRSAVVAEGILYWWGPQGIYRDDGVQTPTKISHDLEPNIYTDYDPAKTLEITASYNINTKEIVWCYTPNPTLGETTHKTYSLVLNTVSGNMFRRKYVPKIDWMAQLQADGAEGWNGHRMIVGSRFDTNATVQRAYFHDQNCRSGDIYPLTEFPVREIQTPTPGTKRLIFAAGVDTGFLNNIQVGNILALQGVANYTGTPSSDIVAKVSAVDRTGNGTVDFLLPTGATLPDQILTRPQYFQVYFLFDTGGSTANGFDYQIKTNYWTAGGLNAFFYFLWIYLFSKIRLWKTDIKTIGPRIEYRTPTANRLIGDDLVFEDNSDGNWQVYHQLRTGNDNHEGQALRVILSGTHLAHEWVLQYLELHATPYDVDGLRQFEA